MRLCVGIGFYGSGYEQCRQTIHVARSQYMKLEQHKCYSSYLQRMHDAYRVFGTILFDFSFISRLLCSYFLFIFQLFSLLCLRFSVFVNCCYLSVCAPLRSTSSIFSAFRCSALFFLFVCASLSNTKSHWSTSSVFRTNLHSLLLNIPQRILCESGEYLWVHENIYSRCFAFYRLFLSHRILRLSPERCTFCLFDSSRSSIIFFIGTEGY